VVKFPPHASCQHLRSEPWKRRFSIIWLCRNPRMPASTMSRWA
jgi:hypothetical protein